MVVCECVYQRCHFSPSKTVVGFKGVYKPSAIIEVLDINTHLCAHLYPIDVRFRVRTAALRDICEVFAEGSKEQQNLQLLPWERHRSFNDMVDKLDEMARAIEEGLDPDCQLWPTLTPLSAHVRDEVRCG